jgi:hypothetical protein
MEKSKQLSTLHFMCIYIYISDQSHPSLPLSISSNYSKKMAFFLRSKLLHHLQPFVLLVFFSFGASRLHASPPPLTLDYYASTCPTVLETVRKELECEVQSDPRNAALILRLHFHDCFVQVRIYIVARHLSLLYIPITFQATCMSESYIRKSISSSSFT